MGERQSLPNYDPVFCLKVVRWGAATCLGWLAIAVGILTLVDPTNSRCPGWVFAENGHATSLWVFVALFTAAPTIWICFVVLRWDRFSQRIYDAAAGTYTPFPFSESWYHRNKPDPFTFPYNQMFVMISFGSSLFCTAPLWIMLDNCVSLYGSSGH
jgi:hypothetical protein